jgi:hypothetical protein
MQKSKRTLARKQVGRLCRGHSARTGAIKPEPTDTEQGDHSPHRRVSPGSAFSMLRMSKLEVVGACYALEIGPYRRKGSAEAFLPRRWLDARNASEGWLLNQSSGFDKMTAECRSGSTNTG